MTKWLLLSVISWGWIATANPPSYEQQVRIIPVPTVMQSQLAELISPVVKDMTKKMPCDKAFAQVFITPQLAILVEMHCIGEGTEVRYGKDLPILSAENPPL